MKYIFVVILFVAVASPAHSQSVVDSGRWPWKVPTSLTFSVTYLENTLSGVYDQRTASYDTVFEDATATQELNGSVYYYPDSSSLTVDTVDYNWDRAFDGRYHLRIIFVRGVDSIAFLTYSFDTTFDGNTYGFDYRYSLSLYGLRYDSSSIICPDSSLAHASFSKSFDDGAVYLSNPPTFFQTHVTSIGLVSMTLGGIFRPITLSAPAGVAHPSVDKSICLQSSPNPFSRLARIKFMALQGGYAELMIFGLLGNKVADVYSGDLSAGTHSFNWEPRGEPPGIYECVLRTNGTVQTLPIVIEP